MFFFIFEIEYDIVQTCVHMCEILYYVDIKRNDCKAKWETIYIDSILFKMLTKSLVIGPIALIL